MALTLKEQFQIKTVAAFEAADGTKFHMLTEAQGYTRSKMLSAIYKASCKAIPEVIKIDEKLFIDLCLNAGRQIGAVMAEPLDADSYDKEIAEQYRAMTTAEVKGTMSKEAAERFAATAGRVDGVKVPYIHPDPYTRFAERTVADPSRAAERFDNTPAMPRAVGLNPSLFAPYNEDSEAELDKLIGADSGATGLRAAMQRVDDDEEGVQANLDAAIARELATGS